MSDIIFRNYSNMCGITDDYFKVRDFFAERGYCEFTYARWDWMTTHSYLEKENISRIGLWEEHDRVVAVAAFDCQVGETFLVTLNGYEHLKQEMVVYAQKELNINENFCLVIPDTDTYFQRIAAQNGFVATPEKEFDSVFFPGENSLDYKLPDGFFITDMKRTFDLLQYERVLWKGFNHELDGEGLYDSMNKNGEELKSEMLRPNVDLELKIAVVTPEGNFAAYCGMWYDEKAGYAVIEPVATDPDYRKMGLGKAAVLEGIKRTHEMGAKFAVVGSSQQFYYCIGLRPFASSSKWRYK